MNSNDDHNTQRQKSPPRKRELSEQTDIYLDFYNYVGIASTITVASIDRRLKAVGRNPTGYVYFGLEDAAVTHQSQMIEIVSMGHHMQVKNTISRPTQNANKNTIYVFKYNTANYSGERSSAHITEKFTIAPDTYDTPGKDGTDTTVNTSKPLKMGFTITPSPLARFKLNDDAVPSTPKKAKSPIEPPQQLCTRMKYGNGQPYKSGFARNDVAVLPIEYRKVANNVGNTEFMGGANVAAATAANVAAQTDVIKQSTANVTAANVTAQATYNPSSSDPHTYMLPPKEFVIPVSADPAIAAVKLLEDPKIALMYSNLALRISERERADTERRNKLEIEYLQNLEDRKKKVEDYINSYAEKYKEKQITKIRESITAVEEDLRERKIAEIAKEDRTIESAVERLIKDPKIIEYAINRLMVIQRANFDCAAREAIAQSEKKRAETAALIDPTNTGDAWTAVEEEALKQSMKVIEQTDVISTPKPA